MRPTHLRRSLTAALVALALAACGPDTPGAPDGDAGTQARGAADRAAVEPVALEDVMETGEGYIVGISYPRSIEAHPGLARALRDYADAARDDLA